MSFPAYRDYKNSGVEWANELPAHWKTVALKWVSRIYAGGTPDKNKPYYWENGSIPWLNSGAVNQVLISEPSSYITIEAFNSSSARWIPAGSLVIALAGQGKTKGMVAQLAIKTTCNQSMAAIVPDFPVVSRYLFWWLSSNYQNIRNMAGGDLRDGLNLELVGNIAALMPTEAEQTQIAQFLDHETARIDALIEEQQRLIELLKEKRQAVISHAVTKGLDPAVPMKDSGVEWLGEVPAHWVCKSYRYASTIYRGKFSHRPRNDPSLYDGGYAFIQTGDIARAEKYIIEYKQTLNEKGASISQKFPFGTLVMAIAANVGDTAILGFEAYAPDSVVGFKPGKDIELEFLRFSLMAALQELKKTSTQSTQANLNIDRISGIKSVFPPLAEQRVITVYLNEVMERFSLLEKQAEASIELMNERRSALISAAVTGKIDVRGWQPPAGTPSPESAIAEAH